MFSLLRLYLYYHRGKVAPQEFVDDLYQLADHFDQRMQADTVRAYHFGPKFLVELEGK